MREGESDTGKFRAEVNTYGDPPDVWTSNGLRFTTEHYARQYVLGLALRWTAVRYCRVVEDRSAEGLPDLIHWTENP